MPDFRTLVRLVFAERGRVPDVDIVEELAQHAADVWETARSLGVSEEAAIDRVRTLLAGWCDDPQVGRRTGSIPRMIRPPSPWGRVLTGLIQDGRYAFRVFRRQPGYAAIAILTMALGIGATTTLFSVAYGVLLKPLPWPEAERLVRVIETRKGQPGRLRGTVSNGSYLAWSELASTIDALGGYSVVNGAMAVRPVKQDEPVSVVVGRLTPSMFSVLKATPLLGRVFEPDDARIGAGNYPAPRRDSVERALARLVRRS